jgi:hypothetical protein
MSHAKGCSRGKRLSSFRRSLEFFVDMDDFEHQLIANRCNLIATGKGRDPRYFRDENENLV